MNDNLSLNFLKNDLKDLKEDFLNFKEKEKENFLNLEKLIFKESLMFKSLKSDLLELDAKLNRLEKDVGINSNQ